MRKRIPNTAIYLDTSDFYFTSTPNETEIEMSDRFIVSEDRDGSSKEQTISGTLSITNNLNVTNKLTCGSFEITESELTVKHLSVSSDSSNDIWLKVSDFGKLYTPTIYSVFDSTITENAYAKINLQKYSSSDPSKIEFVIPRRESSSYRNSTYTMTKDGFYCVDINKAPTSLGTSSNHWSKAYIDTGNIQNINNIVSISATDSTEQEKNIQGFDSIKSTFFNGCLESLYSISVYDNRSQNSCEPGSLFIANNRSTLSFREDPQHPGQYITVILSVESCIVIRLLGLLTSNIDTAWSFFANKYLRFKRGVLSEYTIDLLEDITVQDETIKNSVNKEEYFITLSYTDGLSINIHHGGDVLALSIAKIRSEPLLYNKGFVGSNYPPEADHYSTHSDSIDISTWKSMAFLNEIQIKFPLSHPNTSSTPPLYTFEGDDSYIEGFDQYTAGFSLMVMRVS